MAKLNVNLSFGSVCSGIEAASCAWLPLGWSADWLSEIEPFPSAVLAYRHPKTVNLGDMTLIAGRIASGEVKAPDVLVGGTPCQAFSIAGLRGGLDDQRGQLTLKYVELLNVIDATRTKTGENLQSQSGKTSPEFLAPQTTPLVASSPDWLERMNHSNLVNDLSAANPVLSGVGTKKPVNTFQSGQSLVGLMDDSEKWPGESLMPNTSEWPNDADVCLLSQALEPISIPQRYYLSAKACAGILRRAEARGRKLPQLLEQVLRLVVTGTIQPTPTQP